MERDNLQASVDDAVARAKVRWPELGCCSSDLLAHVRMLGTACGDLRQFGDELCLACACLQGNLAAARILEQEFVSRVGPSLARLSANKDFTDEVTQLLRQRLLLPPERRLAKYAATGPLLAWLRVVATRIGLSLNRSERPHFTEVQAEHLIRDPGVEGVELPRYREELDRALRSAFGQLEPNERNLLRLHYLDGLNLDRLASLHGVHRATIARRLANLRERMLDHIEREVRASLKISASEFRSVVRLIGSQLDAHVSALLRSTDADDVRTAARDGSKP